MTEEAQYAVDNRATDVRLAVYALLNVIGVVTGLYGYLVKPFERTKLLVGIGSALYLVLMAAWLVVSGFGITSTVFRGTPSPLTGNKKREKPLWLDTECWLPDGVYRIVVRDAASGRALQPSFDAPVTQFVDAKGRLHGDKFCQHLNVFLAKHVPSIQRQD
jgi:hypothetical protein